MKQRRVIAASGILAGVLGVSALGATLANAQDAPEEDPGAEEQPAPEGQPAPDGEAPEGCHRGHDAHLESAADAIGISSEDLGSALQKGQSMAEVAEANGVDPQTVIDAMVAEADSRIEEAVGDGHLSEDQADEMRTQLESRITDKVNGESGAFGFDGHQGFAPPDSEFPGELPPEGEGSGLSLPPDLTTQPA